MKKILYSIVLALLLVACTSNRAKYVIGVSQCSDDIWREKQNAELRMAAYMQSDVELRFAAAYDSDERQVQQIDSLVSTGIDLLIVAPNQVATISPAIDRAYDQGIPVIVFERKTNSQKYTAFISADNHEMGRVMGDYIASRLKGRGRVLEVMGLKGSSPAIERHNGFVEALSRYPGIQLVDTLQGDWTEQSGYEAVSNWLSAKGQSRQDLPPVDFVFGQNDRMAMGARKALNEELRMKNEEFATAIPKGEGEGMAAANSSFFTLPSSFPRFCGIDGLSGEGGGIQLVRDSVLDASYIYPTHGDQLLDVAIDILDGKPYAKEFMLKSALVTRDNASVLLMQSDEILRQTAWLDELHQKADNYLQQLGTQRVLSLLLGVIVLLVTLSAVFVMTSMRRRHRLERQAFSMVVNVPQNETVPAIKKSPAAPAASSESATATSESATATSESAASPSEFPAAPSETAVAPSAAPQPAAPQPAITAVTPEEQASIEAGADADARFLERLRARVQEQMADSSFSVEVLAAQMGVSRVQLYRKVKAMTGRTPVDIIRLSRLNRSKALLLTTDLTVSEVAYQTGFSSPSYFTKCFKEEFGMLPGDSRS